VRLSTVILPLERWPQSREKWRRAQELGFYAAYTYDHLSWLRLQDRPWFAAVPTLTGAALETSTIRLGTLVTSPNFRHPVPLAKDLLSLDDMSDGRLTVGVGAGGTGNDATVLANEAWGAAERMDRFIEFVELLDVLLREPITTRTGDFYGASEARMLPGTLQRPRPPLYLAAAGRRGLDVVVRYAEAWVSIGRSPKSDESCYDAVTSQVQRLSEALEATQRESASLQRVLLDGLTDEKPLVSLDAFVDWAGRYQALGITELVIHWPEPDSIFDVDLATFERIATEGLRQLDR
jgi:alkanesulfonate monooxygenase SsuD/methylene tetrahydromethanopterin reductase-like flavin-dependent oxidoreductase (luciferase family)